MTGYVVFDPLLPLAVLIALAVVTGGAILFAIWRRLRGWAFRALAALLLIASIAGPSWQKEDRAPLSDIVLLVQDRTASQTLADRPAMTEAAAELLSDAITSRPNTELRRVYVPDAKDNAGTQVMAAINEALAKEPRGRIAGIIALSDGVVHDAMPAADLPAPFHLLHPGRANDWDRRLVVENAPAFAILGEPVTLTLRIEDQGAAPTGRLTSPIDISVDGGAPERYSMRIGQDISLPITLQHGGRNVIEFSVPAADGELTDRNNRALVQINGVRDRLRVLLVSGVPHAGGRTWRNLLKSDSSVDLVHFTILRPPDKQDGVPVNELSLIAFPTRELFMEKIDDFDLIIFDRFKRRGILPSLYIDNVRSYIEGGGAVLVAAGPDFAGPASIFRSALSRVLPADPTARIYEQAFRPKVTDIGARHPVTAGLGDINEGNWGRWLRQIELVPRRGDVVMSGVDDKPLLVLDRFGDGRIALLASDQAWLWDRGFEGGGPQAELLRRLAHWMMKEPELEEEALWAEPVGQTLRIIRQTLGDAVGAVEVTTPSGETIAIQLDQVSPGRFEALITVDEIGLYRIKEGGHAAVVGVGPAAPREFEETVATDAILRPVIKATRGGVFALADGVPAIRDVRPGRVAAGRGWIGITPRNAYETVGVSKVPLLPVWLVLLLGLCLITAAWLFEGRR